MQMARVHGQFYVANYDLSEVVAALGGLGVSGITYGSFTNLGGEAFYMDISGMTVSADSDFETPEDVRMFIAQEYELNYKVQYYSHQYQYGSI